MKFFERLLGRRTDDERAQEDFAATLKRQNAVTDTLYERYWQSKRPVLDECLKRVTEDFGVQGKRAEELAAIAGNIAGAETYRTEESLAPFSPRERTVVSAVAGNVVSDPERRPVVAETAWWLAQFILNRDYVQETKTLPEETLAYSVRLLGRAVELRPSESRFCGTFANTYMAARDFRSAYDWASRAVELEPSYVEGWRLKGVNAFMLGRFGEADACYEKGLALNPQELGIRAARADLREARRLVESGDLPDGEYL
jgi:tetratricopeptide (TPR) repeat protein